MARAKILLVEDEPDIREVLKFRLEHNDFEVAVAQDGEQGFQLIEEFKPEMIICDLRLPKINGYSLASKIKNHPRYKRIPLIVLGADAGEKNRLEEIGVEAFMAKPFEPVDLMEKIADLLMKKNFEEMLKNGQNPDY